MLEILFKKAWKAFTIFEKHFKAFLKASFWDFVKFLKKNLSFDESFWWKLLIIFFNKLSITFTESFISFWFFFTFFERSFFLKQICVFLHISKKCIFAKKEKHFLMNFTGIQDKKTVFKHANEINAKGKQWQQAKEGENYRNFQENFDKTFRFMLYCHLIYPDPIVCTPCIRSLPTTPCLHSPSSIISILTTLPFSLVLSDRLPFFHPSHEFFPCREKGESEGETFC